MIIKANEQYWLILITASSTASKKKTARVSAGNEPHMEEETAGMQEETFQVD